MELEQLINKDYVDASAKYYKLNAPEIRDDLWYISGSIDIIDDKGKNWAAYYVDIRFPNDYPKSPPDLIEIGNKIIRHQDWHINMDGTCCLAPRANFFLKLKNNITLLGWLECFALPFLANHIYKEKTGEYAAKEYPHGAKGIIESYREIFNLNSDTETILLLKYIIGERTMSRNDSCFCGSGKKYKKCYLTKISEHCYNIPLEVFKKDFKELHKTPF